MFVVGVTGGIGCGKSLVTSLFERCGISIIDTDVISRQSVALGSTCLEELTQKFSSSILLDDGNLDRKKLREIIFTDSQAKAFVESVIHPVVRSEILHQINTARSAYCILASPLLFETKQTGLVDRILVVDVPPELQLLRTMKRDQITEEQIKRITDSQVDRQFRLEHADDVIDNSGSIENTNAQVLHLHELYLSLA